MAKEPLNTMVNVRRELIPALKAEAEAENRSLAGHVSLILRHHLERQAATAAGAAVAVGADRG